MFLFLQLSGWTSNLVDMIMGHHFSTVRTHRHTDRQTFLLQELCSFVGRCCKCTELFTLCVCVCLQDELTENKEIIQTYRLHISQDIPQDNLAMFYNSYDRWGPAGLLVEVSDG